MAAKIPDLKFDKDQMAWARWAQNEITSLKQRLNTKDQSDANINQGTSATLALLGEQIQALTAAESTLTAQQAELAARATYSASSMANVFWTNTTTGTAQDLGISLNFTLTQRRVVLLTLVVEIFLATKTGDGAEGTIAITGLPGSIPSAFTSTESSIAGFNGGATESYSWEGIAVVEYLATLPAGSYSLGATGLGKTTIAPSTQGQGTFKFPILTAQVLQTA